MKLENPLIYIENLSFQYASKKILDNITLKLYPGRHYILAGPNGAGKSTLIDLIFRLRNPFNGNIFINSINLKNYKPLELAKVMALSPQETKFNFSFTVKQMVSMGRRPYLGRFGLLSDEDIDIINKAIIDMGLQKLSDNSIMTLSGGEKQRTVTARALAQSTKILVMDEPTAGLDIKHALSLMSLAKKKAAEGHLVLTVTHDLNLAATFGDEFIFLKNGCLMACGSCKHVFNEEILSKVYESSANVTINEFTGGLQASFKLENKEDEI